MLKFIGLEENINVDIIKRVKIWKQSNTRIPKSGIDF